MHKYGIAALLLCTALSQSASAHQDVFGSIQDGEKMLAEMFRQQGGYLGIFMEETENAKGVRVSRVVLGSPADQAGIKNDDVIVSIDGKAIASPVELRAAMEGTQPGQSLSVEVERNGARQQLTVTLGDRPAPEFGTFNFPQGQFRINPIDPKNFQFGMPDQFFFNTSRVRLGVMLLPMSDQLRDYFGVEAGKGALVSSVSKNSAAERAGIRAGDVILSIDGQQVAGAGDVSRVLGDVTDSKTVQVEIVRDRSRQTLSATVEEGRPANEE